MLVRFKFLRNFFINFKKFSIYIKRENNEYPKPLNDKFLNGIRDTVFTKESIKLRFLEFIVTFLSF